MKNYIKHIFLGVLAITFWACDEQDVEPVVSTDNYPVATFQVGTTTVNEGGGTVVPVTITLDKAFTYGITFGAEVTGGTATLHEDFDFSNVTVPAYSNQATFNVEIYDDVIPEGTETIELQMTLPSLANKYFLNPTTVLPSISISIENFESDVLDISFGWDQIIDGYHTGGNIDHDIFLADGEGYDNADPWATVNWNNFAATGSEPEEMSFDINDWADGEYIFFHDLWWNGFFGYGPAADVLVPIVATFTRAGVFSQVVVQDDSQAINANSTEGYVDDNNDETGSYHNGFIAKMTIADGEFTISDYAGNDLVTGKHPLTKRTSRPETIIRN